MVKELRDVSNLKYYEVTQNNPIIIKLETSKRKKLYHYTTNIGAKGILQSNCLWVTHSNFLDDVIEIKYISVVLEGVIRYLKQNKDLYDMGVSGEFHIYEAIIKTLEAQREIYKYGAPIRSGNLFLLSLTENENNKYLIKNYCKEKGAILEFENKINDMFKENKNILAICSAKVVYDYAKQMTLIIEDINEFYAELLNTVLMEKRVDYREIVETIKSIIYLKILNYSFFFKHNKYFKEEEYRVLFLVEENYDNNVIKHRIISNRRIPYIKVNFDKESLLKTRFI